MPFKTYKCIASWSIDKAAICIKGQKSENRSQNSEWASGKSEDSEQALKGYLAARSDMCPKYVPRLAGPANAGEKSGKPVKAVRAVRIVRYCPWSGCRGRRGWDEWKMKKQYARRQSPANAGSKTGVRNTEFFYFRFFKFTQWGILCGNELTGNAKRLLNL